MPIFAAALSEPSMPTSDDQRPKTPGNDDTRSGMRAFAAAYTMVGAVGAGLGIGLLIDRAYGTKPAWTLGLSLFGLAIGLYQVIKETMR
jgi:F0F1-type ATP synthase assembly protein I